MTTELMREIVEHNIVIYEGVITYHYARHYVTRLLLRIPFITSACDEAHGMSFPLAILSFVKTELFLSNRTQELLSLSIFFSCTLQVINFFISISR